MGMNIRATIKPSDLNIANVRHMFGAFDHHETEISARWIVRFCESNGDTWDSFSEEELTAFYCEKLGEVEVFHFNKLIERGWVDYEAGTVKVQPGFVGRCVKACAR